MSSSSTADETQKQSIVLFPKPINRVAIISQILPFLTNDINEAIYYSSISPAFRDSIQNYASEFWMNIWRNFTKIVLAPRNASLASSSSNFVASSSSIISIEKHDFIRKFCRIFGARLSSSSSTINNNLNNNDASSSHSSSSSSCRRQCP